MKQTDKQTDRGYIGNQVLTNRKWHAHIVWFSGQTDRQHSGRTDRYHAGRTDRQHSGRTDRQHSGRTDRHHSAPDNFLYIKDEPEDDCVNPTPADGAADPGTEPNASHQRTEIVSGTMTGHSSSNRATEGNSHAVAGPTMTRTLDYTTKPFRQFSVKSRRLRLPQALKPKTEYKKVIIIDNGVQVTKFQCNHCRALYKTKWGLQVHERKDHNDNPRFRCNICHQGFSARNHFQGHMNKHLNYKAFQCPRCLKTFSFQGSLSSHMKKPCEPS